MVMVATGGVMSQVQFIGVISHGGRASKNITVREYDARVSIVVKWKNHKSREKR